MTPELRNSNPQLAQLLDQMHSVFARHYDLSSHKEKSTFMEGWMEIGKRIVNHTPSVDLDFGINPEGQITSVKI